MSNDRSTRDRGNLFTNAQKLKPSQPDFQGDCTIDGTSYEILGYRREDQMTVSLAPPRGDRNTYPPAVFKGALEAAPPKPAKSKRGAAAEPAASTPAWTGTIESEEAAYQVSAFEKQGKSGLYFTLSFERTEKTTPTEEWEDPAPPDDAD
ncbi:MAG: hypothetical protein M3680_34615 [Myxococcota bacterium]|nr:hypothetical protein [Myxococcota bacterium]